jgi:NAD+ synthase (glutamine-hydrolysing)
LFKDITKRNGACYAFSNLRGCDGNRLYFDGCSCIVLNGKVLAKSDAFSLKEVEVTTCDIDLQEVRNIRINIKSRSLMASK